MINQFIESKKILDIKSIPVIANRKGVIFDKYKLSLDGKINQVFIEDINSKVILGKSDDPKSVNDNNDSVHIKVNYLYADKQDMSDNERILKKTKTVDVSVNKKDLIDATNETRERANIENITRF